MVRPGGDAPWEQVAGQPARFAATAVDPADNTAVGAGEQEEDEPRYPEPDISMCPGNLST